MTPLEYLILCVVTVVALLGISQIPLVSDAVAGITATSSITATEIWAGIAGILLFFYTVLAVFTMRV